MIRDGGSRWNTERAGYEAPAQMADLARDDAPDGDRAPDQTALELLLCPLGLLLVTL